MAEAANKTPKVQESDKVLSLFCYYSFITDTDRGRMSNFSADIRVAS